MSILNPFQLLELNVISAQDLAPVSRSMRTYAVAWVHPDRKLSTRVDTHGHANPTWNDKFVFRVDEDFLHNDTSAVMIEIYALHWFKDVHVGTVRILVGNLIPTRGPAAAGASYHSHNNNNNNHNHNLGMRFVALQVRRPSGRPQGILNIGVAILHSAMRSMPIYSQLSTSAVGYRELMGEEDPIHHGGTPRSHGNSLTVAPGPELRRTKSDTSSMIGSEIRAKEFRGRKGGQSSSLVGSEATARSAGRKRGGKRRAKGSSVVSGAGDSEVGKNGKGWRGKIGKSSSVVNNGNSEVAVTVDPPKGNKKGKIGKAGSVVNGGSEVGVAYVERDPPKRGKSGKTGKSESPSVNGYSDVGSYEEEDQDVGYFPPKKVVEVKPIVKALVRAEAAASPRVKPSPRFSLADRGGGGGALYRATPRRPQQQQQPPGKSPFQYGRFQAAPYEYGTPRKTPLVAGGGVVFLTESELGPSPSEVAAALAKHPPVAATAAAAADDGESSVLGAWSVDESVEGLRSKLERWRTELPPVYDRGELSSYPSSDSRHVRRHTDGGGGSGLFSCFSNICGVECSIVCGGGGSGGSKKGGSDRIIRSPSVDNLNYK